MKRFFYLASLLSLLSLSAKCYASTALLGGSFSTGSGSDDINYPLIYEIDIASGAASFITVDGTSPSEIKSIAMNPSGAAVIGGENFSAGTPFIYQLAEGASTAKITKTSSGTIGTVIKVAITSNGVAILGGFDQSVDDHGMPLVYSLPAGTNTVSAPALPTGGDAGAIFTVIAKSDGTAILAGENGETTKPLIYNWVNGKLSLIENPNTDEGIILSSAVASDNTVFLGGTNSTTNAPLIYRVIGTTIDVISTPFGDTGQINSIAIDSDGNAILGGTSDSNVPLVYRLSSGASSVSSIVVPAADGSINSIAIGPDNAAILGGEDNTNDQSLIYRLPSGSTTLSLLGNSDLAASITCVGIDSSGTAILGGYTVDNTPIAYSLAQNAQTAEVLSLPVDPDRPFGQIFCVAIYNPANLYDFYRLRSLYNQDIGEARSKLRSAKL